MFRHLHCASWSNVRTRGLVCQLWSNFMRSQMLAWSMEHAWNMRGTCIACHPLNLNSESKSIIITHLNCLARRPSMTSCHGYHSKTTQLQSLRMFEEFLTSDPCILTYLDISWHFVHDACSKHSDIEILWFSTRGPRWPLKGLGRDFWNLRISTVRRCQGRLIQRLLSEEAARCWGPQDQE